MAEEPAFAHGNPEQGGSAGMALRDYLAGQALIGLLSGYYSDTTNNNGDAVTEAYLIADAMMSERAKK